MTPAPRIIALALSCCFISACATNESVTHTPEEWIEHHQKGSLMRGTKVVEVKRPRNAVEKDLSEYAAKCIDGMVTVSRLQQGMQLSVSKVQHTARLKPSEAGKSILSIQTKDQGYAGPWQMHPDGFYFFAAEIQTLGPKTTKITNYYLTMSEPYVADVSDWANGVKSKCPKTQLK